MRRYGLLYCCVCQEEAYTLSDQSNVSFSCDASGCFISVVLLVPLVVGAEQILGLCERRRRPRGDTKMATEGTDFTRKPLSDLCDEDPSVELS